jgi:hypothetical protein
MFVDWASDRRKVLVEAEVLGGAGNARRSEPKDIDPENKPRLDESEDESPPRDRDASEDEEARAFIDIEAVGIGCVVG